MARRLAPLLALGAALLPPRHAAPQKTRRRAETSALSEAGEYETLKLDAEFPAELRGTLYRLGPGGAQRRGEQRDPYSFCVGLTFLDGACFARARYVRTEAFLRDRRAMPAGSATCEKNVGKRLLYWADRLFALTDGCKPYMVDPLSLGTQKRTELGGLLENTYDGFDEGVRVSSSKLSQAFFEKGLPFIGGDAIEFRDFDADFRASGVVAELKLPKGALLRTWAPTASSFVCVLDDDSLTIVRRGGDAGPSHVLKGDVEIITASDGPTGVVMDALVDSFLTRISIDASGLTRETLSERKVNEVAALGEDLLLTTAEGGLVVLRDGQEAAAWDAGDRRAGAPTAAGGFILCLLHGADETEVAAFDASLNLVARAPLPHPCSEGAGPFVASIAPTLDELKSAEVLAKLFARKASEWNEVDGGFSGLGIKSFLFPKGVSGG